MILPILKVLGIGEKRRKMKKIAASIIRLGYFEDCSGKPNKVERITHPNFIRGQNIYGACCDGIEGGSCSLYYCWPWPLSKEEAYKLQSKQETKCLEAC